MRLYELVIDHNACWGCRTCEVACKQELGLPDGVHVIYVSEQWPEDENGRPCIHFRVNVCRHCDDPPCREACPDGAIAKREDGIVVLDDTRCTGCQTCLETCPYEAIAFNHYSQQAVKCNLCHHRIDNGLLPACADNVCLAHCFFLGDRKGTNK